MHDLCPGRLLELAKRCLHGSPSPALDGRIYCAIHGVIDANDLSTARAIEARARGEVLVLGPGRHGWVAAPRFTSDLDRARSLLPSGLLTISRDPMIVCSTALAALALVHAPATDRRRTRGTFEHR